MKRWKHILTAGILSVGLLIQSIPALAADSIIKNGSFHIDQFGKYDILAAVEVKDGFISDVKVTGENFSGSYAETNRQKLMKAAGKITEQLKGISASDAEKIMGTDTVSGATVSCEGIKKAVLNALNLTEKSDTTGTLEKVPEAGEYNVTVSVKSDVVEHSLVGAETATAKLHVDKNGKMQLSFQMVSGTDKEPMYILGFNGYYRNNDRSDKLLMDDASVKTETNGEYTTVQEVAFPLQDLSGVYYTNSKIYVPAMDNLNGAFSGVYFENGTFDVDNIVTVYWNTLKSTGSDVTKNMEISATIEETPATPEYSVIIPTAVSMGTVSTLADSNMAYDITVRTADKSGTITVSAPEEGELQKQSSARSMRETLRFTNDFGKQTVSAEQQATKSEESILKGSIHIAAADVQNVSAGTYSGSTVFTIQYDREGEAKPDKKPGGSNNSGASSDKGMLGNNTLGGNKLGSSLNSSLNHASSLGTGGLGGGNSLGLKSLSSVKTSDTDQNQIFILMAMAISAGAVLLISLTVRFRKRKAQEN